MNIIFRISIIKSVVGIEIGSIGTDYRVLRGRFPHRKNRYVGSTVGVKDQNRYKHFNGIHYGNCMLYGDSIMNPIEMCVHVMILKVLLLNGF